jgi:hypothetical protein
MESELLTYQPEVTATTPWGWMVFAVLLTVVGAAIWYIIRQRRAGHLSRHMRLGVLKVTLPKQFEQDDDRRDPKDIIGLMEPVYSSLLSFLETKTLPAFLRGQETFSFEIAVQHGEVLFYVVAPKDALPLLEQQIHAQYPAAHIEPDHNYLLFDHTNLQSAVCGFSSAKSYVFPIRTYRLLENDPLNSVTNTLSKVTADQNALIQVLVQPRKQNWQRAAAQALQNIQQGKGFEHNTTVAKQLASAAKDVGKTIVSKPDDEQARRTDAMNSSRNDVRLTAMQENQAKLISEKGGKVGFNVQIRMIARAETQLQADQQLQSMIAGFAQFNAPEMNSFTVAAKGNRQLLIDAVLRSFSSKQPRMVLNTEELASVFHFPNRHLDTPNVHWLGSRRLAPPVGLPQSGLQIGYAPYRGADIPVFLTPQDRARHVYSIGSTGVGKTNLFQNMALQDIRAGHGICYMDPNGDAIEWILRHIPKERAGDVILFDPSDTARPIGLNMMDYDRNNPEEKTKVINEMMSIFDKLYDLKATGGPMFEQYMRNAMLLVMEDPDSGNTLIEIPRVLAQEDYRAMKLKKCRNPLVIDFWEKEAGKAGGDAALANIVPYITSKLTQFTSSDIMRPIIAQQESAFNFREVMDQGKILLVALPKGLLGDISARLLGMIISGKIQIAAFSRQNLPEDQRRPFYLYVDEFQNFTSNTFATILSEARKYALGLNITHQYIDQLDEQTRSAVFGNVGNLITWRVGAHDAEFLAKPMDPLQIEDFVNVEKYTYYAKLLINGAPHKPFTVKSLAPDPHDNPKIGEAIRELSRLTYGRDREVVEAEIRLRLRSAIL